MPYDIKISMFINFYVTNDGINISNNINEGETQSKFLCTKFNEISIIV